MTDINWFDEAYEFLEACHYDVDNWDVLPVFSGLWSKSFQEGFSIAENRDASLNSFNEGWIAWFMENTPDDDFDSEEDAMDLADTYLSQEDRENKAISNMEKIDKLMEVLTSRLNQYQKDNTEFYESLSYSRHFNRPFRVIVEHGLVTICRGDETQKRRSHFKSVHSSSWKRLEKVLQGAKLNLKWKHPEFISEDWKY